MNRFSRLIATVLLGVYVGTFAILPVSAQAVTSTFVLSPRTKNVVVNSTFDVSINIKATAAKKLGYARAILAFDPTMLEITQSVEAGSMFCNYPTDAANYISDNEEGQLMITGVATGQTGCAYPEVTTAGTLFARVTFKAKKKGTAELSFLFNGREADGMSGIMDTNSPPQFIMSAPTDGAYSIVTSVATATPTPKPPGNLGVDPRIVIGVAIVIGSIGWFLYPKKGHSPRVVTTTEV